MKCHAIARGNFFAVVSVSGALCRRGIRRPLLCYIEAQIIGRETRQGRRQGTQRNLHCLNQGWHPLFSVSAPCFILQCKYFPYLGLNTWSKVEGIGRTSSRHDVNPAQGRNGPADQIYGRSENQGSSDSDAAVDLVLPGMGSNFVTVT